MWLCSQWNRKTRNSMAALALSFGCCLLFSFLKISGSLDTINTSQFLRDGDTLVSSSGSFELGFFSPLGSTGRYLGLWYKKSNDTVLWVANRESPISNKFGTLNITSQGILVLRNGTQNIVWSTNMSTKVQTPVAQLLESGNLVVREANDNSSEKFLWQSFDYPTDTLLPGMKLGSNWVAGVNRSLSSWRSAEDPSHGRFSLSIDLHGYPQLLVKRETSILYRLGPWNGLYFTGFTGLKPNPIYTFDFVFNQEEVYYKFELQNNSVFSRLTLFPLGHEQQLTWSDQTNDWFVLSQPEADQCDGYALCGPNARCDINKYPVCACLDGFVPLSTRDWNLSTWSGGCVRSTPLDCNNNDGFLRYTGIKLPDTYSSWFDKSIGLKECRKLCLKNCSCIAYANIDIREGGSGCLLWFDYLIDLRLLTDGRNDIYVRMAASELGVTEKKRIFSKKQIGIIVSCVILVMGMLISGTIFWKRRRNLRNNDNFEDPEDDMELPIFDLTIIAQATDNFSNRNKLGEGGFGPVYKGSLLDGQEVAVKRLSKSSGQGLKEFKNEVILIAKLQHRNLVKLLGCCIHEDEKMLIYEYMPNKSLDFFIFDQTRRKLLDWNKCISVIGGIARGLLYLHQDSRLRIIHRDIKASNILLDNELNPKISDFGLARMFGGDQTEANTNRVVGTYGYMSPEYASDGLFSVKSDVYSFGVLVLEMVSGKKNRGFRHADQNLNLLGHAWMLWLKGTPLELIDECLAESCNPIEVLRCINVALLCVQQRPEDRPNMSAVVLMLGSEVLLAQPKQPGFFMGKNPLEEDSSENNCKVYSANEVTLTSLDAR